MSKRVFSELFALAAGGVVLGGGGVERVGWVERGRRRRPPRQLANGFCRWGICQEACVLNGALVGGVLTAALGVSAH